MSVRSPSAPTGTVARPSPAILPPSTVDGETGAPARYGRSPRTRAESRPSRSAPCPLTCPCGSTPNPSLYQHSTLLCGAPGRPGHARGMLPATSNEGIEERFCSPFKFDHRLCARGHRDRRKRQRHARPSGAGRDRRRAAGRPASSRLTCATGASSKSLRRSNFPCGSTPRVRAGPAPRQISRNPRPGCGPSSTRFPIMTTPARPSLSS